MSAEEKQLQDRLKELQEELADRERALPAHSIRPSQIMEIEELEAEITEIKERLSERS